MRRNLGRALVALMTVAAAAALQPITPAAGIPGVIDASVAVVSMPGTVSPPGANVLYRVTAQNKGITPFDGATVTDTLPGGFGFRSVKTTAGTCGASGGTVTCDVGPLAPSATVVIDIVAQTSLTPGSATNTATIEPVGLAEPLEYQMNNTATATTDVIAVVSSDSASAFVPGGGSLRFAGHVLRVPTHQYNADRTALVPVEGVIATMRRTTDHAGFGCGAVSCGEGVNITYDEDPSYQVTDPDHPVSADVSFPNDPCNGQNESCAQMWFRKPAMPTPLPVPRCDGAGSGNHPGSGEARVGGAYELCRDRVYKSGGAIRQVVLMISTDPDLLPPIKIGK